MLVTGAFVAVEAQVVVFAYCAVIPILHLTITLVTSIDEILAFLSMQFKE